MQEPGISFGADTSVRGPALCFVIAVVLLTVGASASERPTPAKPWEGRPLEAALLSLQESGLALLFSDRVVHPEMRVLTEPSETAPRARLEELLHPYGLSVEEHEGVLVVVGPTEALVPGKLSGWVVGVHDHRGIGGAQVVVEPLGIERSTDAEGRFEIRGLPPGSYAVRVSAQGYAPEPGRDVTVSPDFSRLLNVELRPDPFLNDEIVVRSSRLTLLQEEPAAPLALDRSALENLPNLGGDLFRAASLLPGLASNDVSAQFVIRGGRQDEVLIALDGQELYSPFHLRDYDNALSIVPMEELSGAELTTGGFPANFGDRMSGVLDLTTKFPAVPRETLLSISFVDALALHSATFGDGRGNWLLSGRRGTIDLAHDVIGPESPSFWSGFGKLEYRLEGVGAFSLRALASGDELGFLEVIGSESKSFRTNYDNRYVWLSHELVLGQRTLVTSSLSTTRILRNRRGLEIEEEKVFDLVDERDLEVTEFSQHWGLQVTTNHTLSWGGRFRRYEADYDYRNFLEPAVVIESPLIDDRDPLRAFSGRFRGDHVEGWVSDRWSKGSLTVESGLRYDHHDLTHDTLWSPRLSAAWTLGERTVLRGSLGGFHQSQRPYELQVEDADTTFVRAERSDHVGLGFEHQFAADHPLAALRVELFRREISHPRTRYDNALEPINSFPEVEPDRIRITPEWNRSEGLEVLLRGARRGSFDWWLAYSLARAEDRLDGRTVPRELDQLHALNLNLAYQFGEHWNLALAWRFHTGWPTTPVTFRTVEVPTDDEEAIVSAGAATEEEVEQVAVLGSFNSLRMPSYHRLDLRLTRTFDLRKSEVVFFVDVQNLYNRKNLAGFDIASDDEDQLVLAEENWPGIYPSLGISWRF
ncbi:MAG: TonB-dependent receptor [Thermoanaerobaculia bacterium]|nr:TonB-dependent receptor [Thermoanaerobaculia bacterium]